MTLLFSNLPESKPRSKPDGSKIAVDLRLVADPAHSLIADTYIGQASVAGNGPKKKTCRECVHWGRSIDRNGMQYKYDGYVKNDGDLKRGYCFFPRLAEKRLFPHSAKSCSMFSESDSPPPAKNPSTRGREATA